MEKLILFASFIGCSLAGVIEQTPYGYQSHHGHGPALYAAEEHEHGLGHHHGHGHGHGHGYGHVSAAPAVYAHAGAYHQDIVKASAPHAYKNSVPAAAIRNIEQVDVTKTITPIITKQLVHSRHSEPALAVGHVHGYTQTSHGAPLYAPVHYNTQYTTYSNPTVGVNGPVTYAGPAVSEGVAVGVQPVAYEGPHYHGYSQGHVAAGPAPVAAAAPIFAGHGGHEHGIQYAAPAGVADANYGHSFAAVPYASHGHGYVGHGDGHAGGFGIGQVVAHTDYNAYAHMLGFKK